LSATIDKKGKWAVVNLEMMGRSRSRPTRVLERKGEGNGLGKFREKELKETGPIGDIRGENRHG